MSMRHHIEKLEEYGDLTRIADRVHWKHEIGLITRESYSGNASPRAILFKNIVDYPGTHLRQTPGRHTHAVMGFFSQHAGHQSRDGAALRFVIDG